MSIEAIIRAELAPLVAEGTEPFDAHSHTGADIDTRARTAEEHALDLEQLGGRSVIFPFCVSSGYEAENRRVIEECRLLPDRLVPFARLDPRVSSAPDAIAVLSAGARGFKLHPRSEAFALDHPNVDAILAVAAEAGVPVLIHAGVGVGSFGDTLVELAERHRGCPLILAHAGISDLAWLWRLLPEHPNIFFDTAWWNPADLLAFFALVPPGRILFGSDAPYMGVALGLAITLRCARYARLSDEAMALIAGGQLAALLAGEPSHDLGPPPAPTQMALSPLESRVVALLTAAGGCVIGGGDPTGALELASLAASDPKAIGSGLHPQLPELIETARSPSPEAVPALALALTLAATPELRSGILTG